MGWGEMNGLDSVNTKKNGNRVREFCLGSYDIPVASRAARMKILTISSFSLTFNCVSLKSGF